MKKSFKLAFGLFLGVAVVGIVRLSLVGMEQGQAGPAGLVAQPAAAAVNVPRVPSLQELTVGRVAQQIADISPTLDAALAEVENLNITESQKNLVRPVLEWLYPAIATWPENREQLLGFPAPARKLFAREYYLKTRQDVGEQLGVEVGFSIAEIFVLEHFPAVVPDDGILDFSDKKLNDLTGLRQIEGLSRILNRLSLDRNKLRALPDDIFDRMFSLRALNLAHNEIHKLPERLSPDLYNLKELKLFAMGLRSLPEHIFAGLIALQYLSLRNNKFSSSLPESLFVGLRTLKILDLSTCQLSLLPEHIFAGLNLEWLDLSNNTLTTLPVSLLGLSKLRDLNLEHNPYLQGVEARRYEGLKVVQGLLARLRVQRAAAGAVDVAPGEGRQPAPKPSGKRDSM